MIEFVENQYSSTPCFPEFENIFKAFELTSFDNTKVVILWQDPYHTPGAAMGLSFSVPTGNKIQPSLRNIFKELESDIGIKRSDTDLTNWANQWVLLLNSVLSVQSWIVWSHAAQGWEIFTDSAIHYISEHKSNVIFVLWWSYAISKTSLINQDKHFIITSAHPSPLSAYRGFFWSRPFSQINSYLMDHNIVTIDWS